MFSIFKNKDAENIASEINKIHSQIYKLRKKNTDGTYSINKKVIEKKIKYNKIKRTKKETKLTMSVGEIVMHYTFSSKNKDELEASYIATSTFPGYYFAIIFTSLRKAVHLSPFPDNDNAIAVKESLISNYKFKDL
jgi:fumarylacetoacetate (FAA) hydrolase family protein|tara:strand:- start:314 stop:721 length:408 start_codon:yes stop_codon:yes gene_type:complete